MCHYPTESSGVCGHIVVDLKRHLITIHNLNRCCSLFEDLVEKGSNEKPAKRKLNSTTLVNMDNDDDGANNPSRKRFSSSHEACHSMANIRLESKSIHPSSVSAETSVATDVYNFDYESESSDDCAFECNSVPHQKPLDILRPSPHAPASDGPPPTQSDATHVSLQFFDTERIIQAFNTFMLTKGGGGRRNTPIKGDICSFRCLVKGIGWENFWDHNALNRYVSLATCSPSTTYGRLRVYERFVHFLRTNLPYLLPSRESMQAIESMLAALKEALGKDRHVRSKTTMTASRERMPHSLDVLREWRSRRESVEVKKLFPLSSTPVEISSKLDEGVFVQLRNYLIVEIILANAQRSGIVEGMLIGEVLKAKDNANKDDLHYIYVEQHKTGYIQPAIIYLTTEVYNYLLLFVTVIIPELPAIGHVRSGDDCHVFQTWLSDCLHTSNVSSCLRNGLKLYGIDDPDGCPTHYRKAASTLISMHKPELQESLSQFMCHSRSTTERHYRHHMAHRGLYSTFTALASCQAMSGEDHTPVLDHTPLDPSPTHPSLCSNEQDHDDDADNHPDKDTNDTTSDSPSLDPLVTVINCREETALPKYPSKWNAKSIFHDQMEEDIFFRVFEHLLDNSLSPQHPVTSREVSNVSIESPQFRPIWERLVAHLGQEVALKKVTDKIRTYGRNHRSKVPTS